MQLSLHATTALGVAVLLAACADTDVPSGETEQAEPAPIVETAQPAEASRPDTTAEALWAHLQSEAYRENWSLWPGKDRLYSGTEPHGMLLTTYINDVARQALADDAAEDLPAGSIIVKENYMPDSTFDAATVMYKVDGYNPEHEDWLFAKYGVEGNVDAFGRAEMCQACHRQAQTGYIYTEAPR